MILRHRGLAVKASLLSGLAISAHAVPAVNVALRASFGAPSFLLELL